MPAKRLSDLTEATEVAASDYLGMTIAGNSRRVSLATASKAIDAAHFVASPEQFGAAGDGVTDDAATIMAAVDFLGAAGGGTLNLFGHSFIGDTSIVVPPTVTVNAVTDRAQLTYTGSGAALEINGVAGARPRRHCIPAIRKVGNNINGGPLWDLDEDSTSVGLDIVYCQSDQFVTSLVRNFHCGLRLRAVRDDVNLGNCFNNTIHLGYLRNNKKSVAMESYNGPGPAAGVNQNTFLGGKLGIDSAWGNSTGRDLIYMPDAECNTNTFVGTNIEKSGNERGVLCNSPANLFLNLRLENATAGYVEFGTGAYHNKFIAGAAYATDGAWNSIIADAGFNNVYWIGGSIGSKGWTLDSDSGKMLFGNKTVAPAYPIQAYGTNRLQIGDASTGGARYYGTMRQASFVQTSGTTLAAAKDHYTLNYASPATITNVVNVDTTIEGLVTILDLVGNITLAHNGTPTSGQGRFILKSGANRALIAKQALLFRVYDGNLYEV